MNEEPIEILLVEDCPEDEELTLNSLRKNKLVNAIHVVRDGAEALEFFSRSGRYARRDRGDPKLVLLDLRLPKLSGLEVLRNLKSDPATRDIPVVVLTASRDTRDFDEVRSLGVNCFLAKPVVFDQFAEVVRQLGMRWLLLREPPVAQSATA